MEVHPSQSASAERLRYGHPLYARSLVCAVAPRRRSPLAEHWSQNQPIHPWDPSAAAAGHHIPQSELSPSHNGSFPPGAQGTIHPLWRPLTPFARWLKTVTVRAVSTWPEVIGGSHWGEGSDPLDVGTIPSASSIGCQRWTITVCRYFSIATQMPKTWTRVQGTQTSGVARPLLGHQPGWVYWAEDFRLGPPDPRHTHPLAVPQLRMSILLPVGIPISRDLTVAIPIYHLLLEVS